MWTSWGKKMNYPNNHTIHVDYPQSCPHGFLFIFNNLAAQFNTIQIYKYSLQQLIKLFILGKRLSNMFVSLG